MDITSVHDSNQILIHVLSSQRSHGEESNIHVPWVASFIFFSSFEQGRFIATSICIHTKCYTETPTEW